MTSSDGTSVNTVIVMQRLPFCCAVTIAVAVDRPSWTTSMSNSSGARTQHRPGEHRMRGSHRLVRKPFGDSDNRLCQHLGALHHLALVLTRDAGRCGVVVGPVRSHVEQLEQVLDRPLRLCGIRRHEPTQYLRSPETGNVVLMAKPTGRATDVDTESRASRFMKSALSILGETGRSDFTVLEVVERSKTSLRSFYQHFSTKDELLLALIDKIMAESTKKWREETTGLDSTAALRVLIDRICAPAESSTQDSINRGLTSYNDRLAETLPREYARVLSPLHQLIQDILNQGIAERELPRRPRGRNDRGPHPADRARCDAAAFAGRRAQRRTHRRRAHPRLLRLRIGA